MKKTLPTSLPGASFPGPGALGDLSVSPPVRSFIRKALEEDLGTGDVTTRLLVPAASRSRAVLRAKAPFVLAGLPFAAEAFALRDKNVGVEPLVAEGWRVRKGQVFCRIEGGTRALLEAERVALNILQRLSGIATLTNEFVRRVAGTEAAILDTRKTTPGMRWLEKYAVRAGGGANHRFGLSDGILIKDNHIRAAGGIAEAVAKARTGKAGMPVEVEAETLEDVAEALRAGADIIMLDNMPLKTMREAVRMADGRPDKAGGLRAVRTGGRRAVGTGGRRAALEASGNVSLDNVRAIARTGVDYISVGALTHSAPAADISMKLE